jgi:uncharacterized protein (DUF2147 family)
MSIAKSLAIAAGALASTFAVVTIAHAASANGSWLRSNGAHILAFDCGGGLGLKVTKSPEPAKVGKTIMCGAKPSGDNKWKGTVLNLDDGQKYSGYVELSGNSLTLSGCVLGGIICKDDTWSRIK